MSCAFIWFRCIKTNVCCFFWLQVQTAIFSLLSLMQPDMIKRRRVSHSFSYLEKSDLILSQKSIKAWYPFGKLDDQLNGKDGHFSHMLEPLQSVIFTLTQREWLLKKINIRRKKGVSIEVLITYFSWLITLIEMLFILCMSCLRVCVTHFLFLSCPTFHAFQPQEKERKRRFSRAQGLLFSQRFLPLKLVSSFDRWEKTI